MTHFKRFFAGTHGTYGKPIMVALLIVLCLALVGTTSKLTAGKESEKPGKGFLGVNIERVSPEDKEEFGVTFGLLVTNVVKGEAAEKAGIKKYDVIQYFNGEKMRRTEDLTQVVRACPPNSQAKIKLVRDKKEIELTATLGAVKEKSFDFDWKGKEGKPFVFKFSGGAYLGVYLHELNPDLAEYFGVKENGGALILEVSKDTPAQKAGLKSGDVIVKFNGKAVANPKDVTEILSDLENGDKADIEILRHNKKETVNAELAEKPGLQNIKVIRGMGGPGENMHFEIPEIPKILYQCPGDEDVQVIIKEKVEKKMEDKLKKAEEKLEKVQEKLKDIDEYFYI